MPCRQCSPPTLLQGHSGVLNNAGRRQKKPSLNLAFESSVPLLVIIAVRVRFTGWKGKSSSSVAQIWENLGGQAGVIWFQKRKQISKSAGGWGDDRKRFFIYIYKSIVDNNSAGGWNDKYSLLCKPVVQSPPSPLKISQYKWKKNKNKN